MRAFCVLVTQVARSQLMLRRSETHPLKDDEKRTSRADREHMGMYIGLSRLGSICDNEENWGDLEGEAEETRKLISDHMPQRIRDRLVEILLRSVI